MFIGTSLALSQFRPILPPGWVASGAAISGEFVNDRHYTKAGGVLAASPWTFTRATAAWRTNDDGKTIVEYAINVPRRDSRGLLLEGYSRKRMTLYPTTPANWGASSPAPNRTTLAADGSFTPQLIDRPVGGGAFSSIRDTATGFALEASTKYAARNLYKFGTSLRLRMYIRSVGTSGNNSGITGVQSSLSAVSAVIGTFSGIQMVDKSTDIKEVTALFTSTASPPSDACWEMSPDGANTGENGTMVGGQLVKENQPGEWILGTLSAQFTQAADLMSNSHASVLGLKSIALTFTLFSTPSGADENVIWHYGNTTDYVRLMYKTSSSKLFAQAYTGGVQQASLDLGAIVIWQPRQEHTVSFSWADNDFAATLDQGAEVTDTSGTAPTGMSTIYLATDAAGANGTGILPTTYAGYTEVL